MSVYKINAVITNNDGIHARTAASLLGVINKYNVEANLKYRDNIVNLKHLIDVIALSIGSESRIEITIEGEDAEVCGAELSQVIENNLGEIS